MTGRVLQEGGKNENPLDVLWPVLFPCSSFSAAPKLLRPPVLRLHRLLHSIRVQVDLGGDPLPSWNNGPAKQAILGFVKTTTDKANPQFVPLKTASLLSTRTAQPGSNNPCIRNCYLFASGWLILRLSIRSGAKASFQRADQGRYRGIGKSHGQRSSRPQRRNPNQHARG